MEKTNKTRLKIKSKIEAIKKLNDQPNSALNNVFDLYNKDLPSSEDIIRRKIGDFQIKTKAKKTEMTDIFGELINTTEDFLGLSDIDKIDTSQKPRLKNKLKKYSLLSAKTTLQSSKQIVIDTVSKSLFSGNGICGTNNPMPDDTLTISPKEFDFLNVLKVSPNSTTGKIMYEEATPTGFVKMNRAFYDNFSGNTYNFQSKNGDSLFDLNWSSANQYFTVSGLQGISGITKISEFITNYYSSIEYPDLNNISKQAMLMAIQGDGTDPKSFTVGMNNLDRLLKKLFSVCGQKSNVNPLNQNPSNQVNEDDEDIESYFDFNNVEGIDIDDENDRLRGVLKFRDCNNFEVPVNKDHIEDFVYFASKKTMDENITNTLNKAAIEAYESSGQSVPLENFQISLSLLYILKLPRAIMSAILSPKMFFPITVVYKLIKQTTTNVMDILKIFSKMFYDIIKQIFWKFIKEFWKYIKKELLNFVKKIALNIAKNQLKRWKGILSALIGALVVLLNSNIGSCEEIYNAILETINRSLQSKIKLPIPGILLALSDTLPGYSTDRSYMNIVEKLNSYGVNTGALYGRDNKLLSVVKGIVEGHTEEMDANSYVKIAMKFGVLATAPGGGGTLITPQSTGVGKMF